MKLYESKLWMHKQIHILKKSPEQIAKELKVSHMTVRRWAKKHQLIK